MAAATCVQRVGHYCNEQGECMRPNFKNQFIEPPEDECQGQCYINRTHWSSTSNSTYNCSASIAPRKRRMSTCLAGTVSCPTISVFVLYNILTPRRKAVDIRIYGSKKEHTDT